MDQIGPMFPKGLKYNTFEKGGNPEHVIGDRWKNWTNASGAVIHEWANGWCTVFYEVDSHDAKSNRFTFARGGYQSGRSFHTKNTSDPQPGWELDGENWRIENLLAELDQAEEWVSRLQVQQLNQIHTLTELYLSLAALGTQPLVLRQQGRQEAALLHAELDFERSAVGPARARAAGGAGAYGGHRSCHQGQGRAGEAGRECRAPRNQI
jgi:hypothetical protein